MARFQVSQAAPHELLPACRLLFADGGAEARCDRLLSDASTSGVFVARSNGGRLHAAALVQVLPGALGVAWAPRGDSAQAIDAATAAACEWLRSRGVKVCQAFAAASEAAEIASLERHGFRHTTQLVMMRREVNIEGDRLGPADSEDYYPPSLREDFVATLLETHRGTLDCPELNGNRSPGQLVEGFQLPERAASSWLLVEAASGPVGVVVMNSNEAALEVEYLGVVPAARGRGFGHKLLRLALSEAAFARFKAVTLSVDARNAPAVKLYGRHGFVEYDRREVWLASWSR